MPHCTSCRRNVVFIPAPAHIFHATSAKSCQNQQKAPKNRRRQVSNSKSNPETKRPPNLSKAFQNLPQTMPSPSKNLPQTFQNRALGPSWDDLRGHLGTNQSQDRKPVAPGQWWSGSRGRFWVPTWVPKRPQDDPKTTQKSIQKMHDFLIALGPVLDRS